MARYNHIVETVGRTPVVRINRLAPEGVNLFVKIEAFNPLGSIKDRLAAGIITAAEQSGELKPGQTVIEASSGNTGIGLAMVCAQRGYPLVVTMPEGASVERRKMLRLMGVDVQLTPARAGMAGAIARAESIVAATPGTERFMLNPKTEVMPLELLMQNELGQAFSQKPAKTTP